MRVSGIASARLAPASAQQGAQRHTGAFRFACLPACIIMDAMGDQEGRDLGMWVDGGGERVIVHVGGEMDIDRAPMLFNALHIAITREGGPNEIVADLSDMSFCDSAGLNALIRARHTAAEYGKHLSLRAPQPQFLRLLDITGAGIIFTITDT
ncbi:STAS domain-containing protein [Streptomyces vinaceus]|uniref:STAS domain-containing protein n=1 Tax=Streptomyces vinaceus TaxID=1960 RepID=UPI0035E12FC2